MRFSALMLDFIYLLSARRWRFTRIGLSKCKSGSERQSEHNNFSLFFRFRFRFQPPERGALFWQPDMSSSLARSSKSSKTRLLSTLCLSTLLIHQKDWNLLLHATRENGKRVASRNPVTRRIEGMFWKATRGEFYVFLGEHSTGSISRDSRDLAQKCS